MKSKLQKCRIYILKKHLSLMRAVIDIKNNERAVQTMKSRPANEKIISRSSYDGQKMAAMMVQMNDQSESAADGGGEIRDLHENTIDDDTTSVRADKETADAIAKVTRERKLSDKKAKMQPTRDEEDKLKEQYRKLMQIRDADARKKARIEKLRKMIAQIPKIPMPKMDDREERAIKELEEMEIQHNCRSDTNKIVNLLTDAKIKKVSRACKSTRWRV